MKKPKDRGFFAGPGGLDARGFTRWYRDEISAQWQSLDMDGIEKIAKLLKTARDRKRRVFVMGNGGSAAIASHMAADFCKTAAAPGKPGLRCICLNDNIPLMTAISNDLGYEYVFSHQLENLLHKGDVVLLISGSGNSPNILAAARLARSRKAYTIGLLGFDGGKLKAMVDVPLIIRSKQYGVIEDMHMSVDHLIAFYLKQQGDK